jgi:UDP-2,3-diacylglucosamine pyrophosphatase LpxH
MEKRPVDVVVISDVHLGTFGCHAAELVTYLKSISPQMLILNGDIVDGWQFSKHYFPSSHLCVLKEIINLMAGGTRVIYITGNHDEVLRRFSDFHLDNFQLTDKLVIEIDKKMTWIFHGDVFDATTRGYAKIIARLGGWGYDLLILLNRLVNFTLQAMGRDRMSFSKKVKNGVKKAISYINNFEMTAAELAIEKQYDYVICGHIHQPQHRVITTKNGSVTYLNSGDWIENLTSLEYCNHEWRIYQYNEKEQPVQKIERSRPVPNVVTDDVDLYITSLAMFSGNNVNY